MKYQSKDMYGPYDSPNIFCQCQVEFTANELTCEAKLWDDILNHINEEVDGSTCDFELYKKFKCPFTKKTANQCEVFVYRKNDKSPNARRCKI